MSQILIENIATNIEIINLSNGEKLMNITGYKVDFILNGLLRCSIQIETTKEMELKEIKEYIKKSLNNEVIH